MVIAILSGLGGAWIVVERTRANLPTPTDLSELRPDYGTRVQTQDGSYLGGERAVEPIFYDELPPQLIATFLAAEDEDFFDHNGYNTRSIGRALVENYRAGQTVQGASTITQQVAKHFLAPDQTWRRKLRELLLAQKIEAKYSKTDILNAYLGGVYFGNNSWGVTQASYTYFSAAPTDLTVGQMATLAGLLPAPSIYNPIDNPDLALHERNRVLFRMHEVGILTDDEFHELSRRPLEGPTVTSAAASPAPEAVNTVHRLWDQIGEERQWADSSLEVVTTHHPGYQTALRRALQQGIEEQDRRRGYRGPVARTETPQRFDQRLHNRRPLGPLSAARITAIEDEGLILHIGHETIEIGHDDLDWIHGVHPGTERARQIGADWRQPFAVDDIVVVQKRNGDWQLWQEPIHQGAAIVTDHHSGEILASVGAYDVDKSQYHRAEQACRQPGSLFKTIVYTEAFSQGITPATLLSDVPTDITAQDGVWQPRNADRDFSGYITALDSYVFSRNIPTVNLFQHIGAQSITERARRMGIESQLTPTPSLALGASCTKMTEVLDVHSTIARGGLAADRRHLAVVRDLWSNRLRDHGHFLQRDPGLLPRMVRATAPIYERERAVDPSTNFLMNHALDQVTIRGTASELPDEWPVGAKTGTSDHFDTWLAAFDPNLTASIWIGSDEQQETFASGEHAGTVAVPVFAEFYDGLAPVTDNWPRPASDDLPIEWVGIDPSTGLRARPRQPAVGYPFRFGTAPNEYAPTGASRQLERFDSVVY